MSASVSGPTHAGLTGLGAKTASKFVLTTVMKNDAAFISSVLLALVGFALNGLPAMMLVAGLADGQDMTTEVWQILTGIGLGVSALVFLAYALFLHPAGLALLHDSSEKDRLLSETAHQMQSESGGRRPGSRRGRADADEDASAPVHLVTSPSLVFTSRVSRGADAMGLSVQLMCVNVFGLVIFGQGAPTDEGEMQRAVMASTIIYALFIAYGLRAASNLLPFVTNALCSLLGLKPDGVMNALRRKLVQGNKGDTTVDVADDLDNSETETDDDSEDDVP